MRVSCEAIVLKLELLAGVSIFLSTSPTQVHLVTLIRCSMNGKKTDEDFSSIPQIGKPHSHLNKAFVCNYHPYPIEQHNNPS